MADEKGIPPWLRPNLTAAQRTVAFWKAADEGNIAVPRGAALRELLEAHAAAAVAAERARSGALAAAVEDRLRHAPPNVTRKLAAALMAYRTAITGYTGPMHCTECGTSNAPHWPGCMAGGT